MKDIILKLSDDDYRKLKWTADKWEVGVTECLRMLIPNVNLPDSKVINEKDVSSAKFDDLISVKKLTDKDRKKLRALLSELFDKKWAVTLGNEIKKQILDKEGSCLTVATYKQLSRWVNPYRQTQREFYVQERALKISELLFGHPIHRVD